jgi:hypothetical protein
VCGRPRGSPRTYGGGPREEGGARESPREWWPRKIVYKITPLGGTRSIHRPARSRLVCIHPSINRLELDSDRKRPSPGARVREGSLLTRTGPTPPPFPSPAGAPPPPPAIPSVASTSPPPPRLPDSLHHARYVLLPLLRPPDSSVSFPFYLAAPFPVRIRLDRHAFVRAAPRPASAPPRPAIPSSVPRRPRAPRRAQISNRISEPPRRARLPVRISPPTYSSTPPRVLLLLPRRYPQ